MKIIFTFICLFTGIQLFAQGPALGEVIGTLVSSSDQSGIPYAIVWIDDNGKKYHTLTDENGKFRLSAIPTGTYVVKLSDQIDTVMSTPIYVPMDGFGNLGTIVLKPATELEVLNVVHNTTYDELKRNAQNSTPVFTLSAKDLQKMPIKFDIKLLATTMSSDIKMSDDGELMFRGSRKGDMIYYLDGVKLNEVQNVPSCSIGNMMVYTGGIPAKYGDTKGGVIVVETKSYFDLLREYEIMQRKKN